MKKPNLKRLREVHKDFSDPDRVRWINASFDADNEPDVLKAGRGAC